jgi:hypothetical protein
VHRKPIFFLEFVFLVLAVIVPIVLVLQAGYDTDNSIIVQNPTGMQTNGNISKTPETQGNTPNIPIAIIAAFVFVSLFGVTLYYGIRHVHPDH